MNPSVIRILFAGTFATVALIGALILEMTGHDCPEWLVAVVAAAVGYIFGHVEANGWNGQKRAAREKGGGHRG